MTNPPPIAPPLKIGTLTLDPSAMLAPMAGISSWPMRLICRQLGAPLCFTEMISAPAVARGILQSDTLNALKTHPDDRPLGYQIYGVIPEELARAGETLAALEADLIDVNMGCPVRKIVHSGSGAAIMKDLGLARRIVAAVRAKVNVPLTVKMRLGWDEASRNAAELARICEGEGADAVIVHGRTRAQGFSGEADLGGIREVVEAVSIPVIGNGGIMSRHNAEKMIAQTGCAGVMPARGVRGNPWLFAALIHGDDSPQANPTITERARMVNLHLDYFTQFMPARLVALEMRKHLSWYSRGIPCATDFRRGISSLTSPDTIRELTARYFVLPEDDGG